MKVITVTLIALLISGCSDFSFPPKTIIVDGDVHYACGGNYVRTFHEGLFGEGSFTVEFTDANGDRVQLRGVNKVTVRDLPTTVWSSLPLYLPDTTTEKDAEGKPYVEGEIYIWSKTEKATLKDGKWERIRIPNPACEKSEN
jgi:hypothetical protein